MNIVIIKTITINIVIVIANRTYITIIRGILIIVQILRTKRTDFRY